MGFKNVIVLGTLLIGSLALPTRLEEPTNEGDFSQWFTGLDLAYGIIGGTPAAEGSAPHMAAIILVSPIKRFYCGGSLISSRTILTAAHCTLGMTYKYGILSMFQVRVGTNRWASGGVNYSIARTISHKDFDRNTSINDIGLIITSEEVKFSKFIKPITISYDWFGGNIPVRAYGWGFTVWNGDDVGHPITSPILMELSMRSMDGKECVTKMAEVAAKLKKHAVVQPQFEVCTFKAVGHGMCFGDSGSALLQISTGQQVGIVSWGIACACGAPDIFTRVGVYKQWIQNNTV